MARNEASDMMIVEMSNVVRLMLLSSSSPNAALA